MTGDPGYVRARVYVCKMVINIFIITIKIYFDHNSIVS